MSMWYIMFFEHTLVCSYCSCSCSVVVIKFLSLVMMSDDNDNPRSTSSSMASAGDLGHNLDRDSVPVRQFHGGEGGREA